MNQETETVRQQPGDGATESHTDVSRVYKNTKKQKNRHNKANAAHQVYHRICEEYGQEAALQFSYDEIIDYLLQGRPFPARAGIERINTKIDGTTAYQVFKIIDNQARGLNRKGRPKGPQYGKDTSAINQSVSDASGNSRKIIEWMTREDEVKIEADGQESTSKMSMAEGRDYQDDSNDRREGDSASKFDGEGGNGRGGGQEDHCSETPPIDEDATNANGNLSGNGSDSEDSLDNAEDCESESESESEVIDLLNMTEARHEAEIRSIQTKVIVQQEGTIARLEEEKSVLLARADRLESQNDGLKEELVGLGGKVYSAQGAAKKLQNIIRAANATIDRQDVAITDLESKNRWALVQKGLAETEVANQIERIDTLESELKEAEGKLSTCQINSAAYVDHISTLEKSLTHSEDNLSENKNELSPAQAEIVRLSSLEKQLADARNEIEQLKGDAFSTQASHEAEIRSINAKHESAKIELKKELSVATENNFVLNDRLAQIEKEKQAEEAARIEIKTARVWSWKFLSSKAFLAPMLALILSAMFFAANNHLGYWSGRADLDFSHNNISTIETECKFVYIEPCSTVLQIPSFTSILAQETTCPVEPGYFGDYIPMDLNSDGPMPEEERRDSEGNAGEDDDEHPQTGFTLTEKAIIAVVIPVTIVVVARVYHSWF